MLAEHGQFCDVSLLISHRLSRSVNHRSVPTQRGAAEKSMNRKRTHAITTSSSTSSHPSIELFFYHGCEFVLTSEKVKRKGRHDSNAVTSGEVNLVLTTLRRKERRTSSNQSGSASAEIFRHLDCALVFPSLALQCRCQAATPDADHC